MLLVNPLGPRHGAALMVTAAGGHHSPTEMGPRIGPSPLIEPTASHLAGLSL
jgi:hypothetical protein